MPVVDGLYGVVEGKVALLEDLVCNADLQFKVFVPCFVHKKSFGY